MNPLWLATLFVPGFGLTVAFRGISNEDSILDVIAYSTGLSSALLVVVFLIGSANQWPIFVDQVLIWTTVPMCFSDAIFTKSIHWPRRPTKLEFSFLAVVGFMIFFIFGIYLAKYPIFSSFYPSSDDYLNTALLVKDLVANGPPALSAQLLYYGIHYHLALLLSLSGTNGNAIELTKQGMGVMAVLSSFYLFLAAKKLAGGKDSVGIVCALIYILTAFLWFGQIYNSGLYPNFYGLMASLFLICMSIDFLSKRVGEYSPFLLGLAFVNACMGHYSDIFLFPPLALVGFLSTRKRSWKQATFFAVLMLIPIVVGAIFFRSYLAFLAPGGFAPDLNADWIASKLSTVPSLAYFFLLIKDPLASIALSGLAVVGVWMTFRAKNWWLFLPIAWLITVFLISPANAIAWRFSFVALLPFLLLASLGFHSLIERAAVRVRPKIRHIFAPRLKFGSLVLSILLFIPLLYGGTIPEAGTNSLNACKTLAFGAPLCYASTEHSVYDAMQWIANCRLNKPNGSSYRGCTFFNPTDVRFQPTALITGLSDKVTVNLDYMTTPLSAAVYAKANNYTHIIVDDYPELYLDTCYSEIPVLSILNSTSGHTVQLAITLLGPNGVANDSARASIYVDGNHAVDTQITNGKVNGTLHFNTPGTYRVNATAGVVWSNTMTIVVGSPTNPTNDPANLYSCRPFYWSSKELGGAVLVYQNSDVKIWCIPQVTRCPSVGLK